MACRARPAAAAAWSRGGNAPRSRSSSWHWPKRPYSCGSGRRARSTSTSPFADLEALREAARLPVARFATLSGIPERTYRRRLAKLRACDEPVEGPWPTPAVDAAEAPAAKCASDWPAWGHHTIAAMMRADGLEVSTSTVERALRRRGLLLPRGFRADRKSWAAPRRKVLTTRPPNATGSGRPTSANSRQRAAGSGASARSSTTPPSTASLRRSPRPAAARTRSPVSTRPLSRPNASSAEGPVTATRHRAGLMRHPVIELAGDGSQCRCCTGGGSQVRQLGRRPSAPLDMVDGLAATRSW